MDVDRYIASFQKQYPHQLVEKVDLPPSSLSDLIGMFKLLGDDPLMYRYYDVDAGHAEKLNELCGIIFDFEKFDYAVGAEAKKTD